MRGIILKDMVWRDVQHMDTTWERICLRAVSREERKKWTDRCASPRL